MKIDTLGDLNSELKVLGIEVGDNVPLKIEWTAYKNGDKQTGWRRPITSVFLERDEKGKSQLIISAAIKERNYSKKPKKWNERRR